MKYNALETMQGKQSIEHNKYEIMHRIQCTEFNIFVRIQCMRYNAKNTIQDKNNVNLVIPMKYHPI